MPETNQPNVYFIALWIVLGLGTAAFFHFNNDAALKRKIWPVFSVGTSILFLAFVWFSGIKGEAMYFMVFAIILITGLNLKSVKFCDSCGKTLDNQSPFSKQEFCPKCGNKLK